MLCSLPLGKEMDILDMPGLSNKIISPIVIHLMKKCDSNVFTAYKIIICTNNFCVPDLV